MCSTPYILTPADDGESNYKLFKAANIVSMVAAPLALANAGSDVMLFDYALCASIPLTAHIGANWVITDYVRNMLLKLFFGHAFIWFVCRLQKYRITRVLPMPLGLLWYFCRWERLQALRKCASKAKALLLRLPLCGHTKYE